METRILCLDKASLTDLKRLEIHHYLWYFFLLVQHAYCKKTCAQLLIWWMCLDWVSSHWLFLDFFHQFMGPSSTQYFSLWGKIPYKQVMSQSPFKVKQTELFKYFPVWHFLQTWAFFWFFSVTSPVCQQCSTNVEWIFNNAENRTRMQCSNTVLINVIYRGNNHLNPVHYSCTYMLKDCLSQLQEFILCPYWILFG